MTYRERREAKVERLRGWAGKREQKADSAYEGARRIMDNIPLGQPILIGHHSEKRHRADIGRIDSGMHQSFEHSKMATNMANRADGIESQLERAIYDDDPDAKERITERIAELIAQREAVKKRDHGSWELSNLSANIRRYKKRLEGLGRVRRIYARRAGKCSDGCGVAIAVGEVIVESAPGFWVRGACYEAPTVKTPAPIAPCGCGPNECPDTTPGEAERVKSWAP